MVWLLKFLLGNRKFDCKSDLPVSETHWGKASRRCPVTGIPILLVENKDGNWICGERNCINSESPKCYTNTVKKEKEYIGRLCAWDFMGNLYPEMFE